MKNLGWIASLVIGCMFSITNSTQASDCSKAYDQCMQRAQEDFDRIMRNCGNGTSDQQWMCLRRARTGYCTASAFCRVRLVGCSINPTDPDQVVKPDVIQIWNACQKNPDPGPQTVSELNLNLDTQAIEALNNTAYETR
ncbi:MAG: hypothetical protein AB7P04_11530 [Bacteriovoracia bacterium]